MMRFLLILIMLMPMLAKAEERLGRLFLTPAERSNLDYIRQTSKPPDRILKPEVAETAEGEEVTHVAPPSAVTVQGYVKRSDGKGTVWVNRQPLRETSSQGEIGVGQLGGKDGRVRLKLSGTNKEVALKAGQTYDPASGVVVEHLRDLPEPVRPDVAVPDDKAGKPVGLVQVAPKKP